MLDSIYHMALKVLRNSILGDKTENFAIFYAMLKWMSLHNFTKSVNHKWFIDFIAWRYITPRSAVM